MKILFAGLGSIGQRHIANLRRLGVRDLLAYRTHRGGQVSPIQETDLPEFGDLDRALDRRPEAVWVTNPTSLHLSVAIPAAKRGCHLFIEKPLSHTLDGLKELRTLVEANHLIAMVGCQLRFDPLLRQARALLLDGAIGRVMSARVHVGSYLPDWHPGEDYRQAYSARRDLGGGVILTLIHELDYVYWLFGDVHRVIAYAGRHSQLELDVEDMAEMILETTSGAVVSVHLDYIQRPHMRTLSIIGETGTLTWDCSARQLRCFSAATGSWRDYASGTPLDPNELLLEEARHFLRCLQEKTEPLIPLREAERVLELALAAKASADRGVPVELHPG